MGLAIDGNVVHGIARGGQAFINIENTNANADGSINIGGQDYLSKNKMKIKDTGEIDIEFSGRNFGQLTDVQTDVTSNLSNYGGCLAICAIATENSSLIISQLIIIPTAPTTEALSLGADGWRGSLSRSTDSRFTLDLSCDYANYVAKATSDFYVLSN